MNAFVLIIPLMVIRYGLLTILSKEALERANFFPPLEGSEKTGYWVYMISNTVMIFLPIAFRISHGAIARYGWPVYVLGVVLYALTMIDYARPRDNGLNSSGLYRFSRNPMYVAYFIYFLGVALLIGSWFYLGLLIVFQASVHWVILSEERWCLSNFGDEYRDYMKRVRRYL